MTSEEAIRMLIRIKDRINFEVTDAQEKMDALNMAIAALEQEPCTVTEFADRCMECGKIMGDMIKDAISRQAVLDQTYLWSRDEFLRVTNPFDYLRKRINSLPSVTPAEKVGRWIMHIDDLFPADSTMECNKCHEHQPITIDDNYCPNCGAKMDVGGENNADTKT